MTTPKKDETGVLELKQLGHALAFETPFFRANKTGKWIVRFDTGIEMHVPDSMFKNMQFTLAEK